MKLQTQRKREKKVKNLSQTDEGKNKNRELIEKTDTKKKRKERRIV